MIISEKRKCNFYNVGYCKNFDKGCKYLHPEESCIFENCNYKDCPKRHQKDCKFFKSKKSCRHGSDCHFKHEKKKTNSKTDIIDETVKTLHATIAEKDAIIEELKNIKAVLEAKLNKQDELKSKLNLSEEALKDAKKQIEKKDSELKSKSKVIKQLGEREEESKNRITTLEKNVVEKNNELEKQVNRNEVIKNVLKKININEQENDAPHVVNNEDSEKESIKCDLKEIKESDAKKHLGKGQKFYCADCLFRTSSQNEFKEHVKRRQHKEQQ